MATVEYVGGRSYAEFTHEGVTYGFARGTIRDDIPEELATRFDHPGYPQWKVNGLNSSEELLAIVEHDDSTSSEADFNSNWTRQEMIKWFSARGESTPRTSTKASLVARAESLLNPAPEVEETVEEVVAEENTEEPEAVVVDEADDGEGED